MANYVLTSIGTHCAAIRASRRSSPHSRQKNRSRFCIRSAEVRPAKEEILRNLFDVDLRRGMQECIPRQTKACQGWGSWSSCHRAGQIGCLNSWLPVRQNLLMSSPFGRTLMMISLGLTILNSGVPLSMLCAVIGLAFAFFLILAIMRHSPGNERMREISAAVQEGAKAYLNRQVKTISVIAVVIFILLFIFKDQPTAIGFVIGAFCSMAAGYVGMRLAVLANVRTTQAASIARLNALRIAFNGGAVTGLLVVGLALLAVSIFYTVAGKIVGHDLAVRSLVGLALGGSLISVFARLEPDRR